MKLLLTHCDFIEYEAKKKAIADAEPLQTEKDRIEECLVAFCSAEDGDDERIIDKAAASIADVAQQVNTNRIVVYPFVHLTSKPAKPPVALQIVKGIEEKLRETYEVKRSPFGWYKSFSLKCKGHPLSELSREIRLTDAPAKAHASKKEESYNPQELLHQIGKTRLDREKLKDNDHRILGQRLDLFSFNELAPGMVFWHHNGLIVYNELINFWREEHRKAGYREISTPQVLDTRLWKISGHWEKYRENIFLTGYEDRDFAVKPMNCPGGMLVYKERPKSYKDLPLRVAELGVVHRQELSGVLGGLFRVIKFTQDDAHLFCTEESLETEIAGVMAMIRKFFDTFGLEFDHVELSTRPEKRIGDEKMWDKAEALLEQVLIKNRVKYKVNPGDGAFYGPKIDFHLKDSLGRTWQCSTIQLDFSMPERFELEYIGSDGQPHRPVMLHRVIYGSLERFIGILIEHTNGAFPAWLAPIQVRIVSFTDRNIPAAQKIHDALFDRGFRIDCDFTAGTVNEKIRNAELQKINYIIVIGDKEEAAQTLAVRPRGRKPEFGVTLGDFATRLQDEITQRTK